MKQIYFGHKLKMSGITIEIRYIYMTRKARLLITILTVISFLAAFFPFVSSLEIDFNYPLEAELNINFKVSINFEANDTYDIKVFVHNSQDVQVTRNEYISDIYNSEKNTWQDSWNYLVGSFPSQKEYSIKVTNSLGDRQVCVRARKTGSSSSFSKCGSIIIKGVEKTLSPTPKNSENNQVNSQNDNQNNNPRAPQSGLDSNDEEDSNVQDNIQ